MVPRRSSTTAPQYHLVGHELAVVLANRAGGLAVAGIGHVGTGRPFPDIAEHLGKPLVLRRRTRMERAVFEHVAGGADVARRDLPLALARQPLARPLCI